MDRSEFIKSTAMGSLGLGLAPHMASSTNIDKDRPNFLWFITEDLGAGYLGCYGNEQADTPNINKLASEGILYENACCSCPVCAPSRSTFMTGVYANSMGTQPMRSRYRVPDFIHFYPYYLEKAGYYCTNNSKLDYNTNDPESWKNAWNESSSKATYRDRAPGQPFHATNTLRTITHESSIQTWIPVDQLKHNPRNVRVPAYLPSTPEVRHDIAQYLDKVEQEDALIGTILERLEKDAVADNTIIFLFSDHGGVLPRSKYYLFDSGMHIPFIMRFPEKYQHLAPSEPGSISDQLVNSIDLAPTILSLAGIDVPSYCQGQVIAGEKKQSPPRYVYGFKGRMGPQYDMARTVRDQQYRYIRHYRPTVIYEEHGWYRFKAASMQSWWEAYKRGQLNDEQAKYFHAVPPEELFDIQKDPDNVHNLVGDPKYENVLKRMRKINAKWIRHVHDSGFIPESMRMRRVKKANTTVYEYVRSSAYRQEEIISMAEVASMGKPENLEKLINGLKDNDAAIRYWAGYGCAILKEKAMPAKGLLIDLLDDPAPEVAIAASEALYHLGETSKSLDRLKKALDNDSANGEIRLRALNVIRALGKGAMPLLPKLQDMLVSVPPPKRIEPSKNSRWINSFIVIRLIKDSLPSSLKSNAGGYVG